MTVRVPEPAMTLAEPALRVSVETDALSAPIEKVAAPLTVRAPKVRSLAPSARVPPLTLVAPVYVLAAFKVRVPAPLLVKAPVPLPKLPAIEILLLLVSNVPPPFRKLMVRVEGSKTPPNFRVPPAKTSSPVVPPILSRASICRTPSLSVVFLVFPPAVLATERTKVPRPDFVMSAVEVSAEPMVAVTEPPATAEVGFWTKTTYSFVAPTVMPPSKPPSVIPIAGVPVTAPVAVKSIAPEVTASVCPAPVPVTLREPVAVFELLTTSALIVVPARPVRLAARDSRILSVEVALFAKVLYSVARSSGRSPAPEPVATT